MCVYIDSYIYIYICTYIYIYLSIYYTYIYILYDYIPIPRLPELRDAARHHGTVSRRGQVQVAPDETKHLALANRHGKGRVPKSLDGAPPVMFVGV